MEIFRKPMQLCYQIWLKINECFGFDVLRAMATKCVL
jgi:hypothetical protein